MSFVKYLAEAVIPPHTQKAIDYAVKKTSWKGDAFYKDNSRYQSRNSEGGEIYWLTLTPGFKGPKRAVFFVSLGQRDSTSTNTNPKNPINLDSFTIEVTDSGVKEI